MSEPIKARAPLRITGGNSEPSRYVGFWPKYILVPGLIVTTTLAILLATGLGLNWVIYGETYDIVQKNRASVQLVVQLLAGILGSIHVFTLSTIINYSTRIVLARQTISLDHIGYWTALCSTRLDLSLPKKSLILVVGFCCVTILPSALWTGALTPIAVSIYLSQSTGSIRVSQYTSKSESYWYMQTWNNASTAVQNSYGTFSYSPVRDLSGMILTKAASASTMDGSISVHTKNDKSGYVYQGRSYGVGNSAGLMSDLLVEAYQYTETGYNTAINCIYNSSTNYRLDLAQNSTDLSIPKIYIAHGDLPNGNAGGGYTLPGLGSQDNIVAVGLVSGGIGEIYRIFPAGSVSYLGIAAGRDFLELNATQCTVTLTPEIFSVKVNTTEKVISVTPLSVTDGIVDIEPRGWISYQSADALLITAMLGSSQWTSPHGTAILTNINNVQSQHTSETTTRKTLRGIEEAFEYMVDSYLGAFASAQIMIAQDTKSTPIVATIHAVAIGQKQYIIGITVLNGLIVLSSVVVACHTHGWRGLPKFDYMDAKSLIVSTSIGGSGLGEEVVENHSRAHSVWRGNSNDRIAGKSRIFLEMEEGLALIGGQSKKTSRPRRG